MMLLIEGENMNTKRIIAAFLMAITIMTAVVPAFAGGTWTCPGCGRQCKWVWFVTDWINEMNQTINDINYTLRSRGRRRECTKCNYYDAMETQYQWVRSD